mmetsp:Transcript_13335/g.30413  ORF Transcript_13335/g.30413 Transcript_13335/m.30413 type:complete len:573 (+) Transcript_13335:55-1773(+)
MTPFGVPDTEMHRVLEEILTQQRDGLLQQIQKLSRSVEQQHSALLLRLIEQSQAGGVTSMAEGEAEESCGRKGSAGDTTCLAQQADGMANPGQGLHAITPPPPPDSTVPDAPAEGRGLPATMTTLTSHTEYDFMKTMLRRASTTPATTPLKAAQPRELTKFQIVVSSLGFEMLSAILILLNTAVLAMEIQFQGIEIGYRLGFDNYTESAQQVWPGYVGTFDVLEVIFSIIFALELLLRVSADPSRAYRSFFIWLDFLLVAFSFFELFRKALSHDSVIFNPTMIRLVRLLRVARVVKMVRSLRALDSLYLIMRSIQASIGALIWSFILLLLLQVSMGMLLFQLIRGYFDAETASQEELEVKKEVFSYFGTFYRTIITMFEITLANWAPSCRLLIDNVSEWYGLFYILYRCMFCFAVVKVIAAVFINETNRVTASDAEIALIQNRKVHSKYLNKLRDRFLSLDTSGDGYLAWPEVEAALNDEETKAWLDAMDLQVSDLEELFIVFDDGDGKISLDEFIRGVTRMKRQGKTVDNRHLSKVMDRIEVRLSALQKGLDKNPARASSMQGSRTPNGAA